MTATKKAGRGALRTTVQDAVSAAVGKVLAKRLLEELDELWRRFQLGDFRPSELSGGRFSEVVFRICQHVCLGTHTPLGKSLPKVDTLLRDLEQSPSAGVDDTLRLHIPRALRVIYDLRNKRDVAHLGAGVSPNIADASLILQVSAWIAAELVRVFHQCSAAEAQSVVDTIVARRTPLIWQEGDIVRVLTPSMKFKDQVLLLLHHFEPDWVSEADLLRWTEYSNASVFRSGVLRPLHKMALIHFADGRARILPPGSRYVEQSLSASLA